MAEFAASIIGIVGAGTKVALVLTQISSDLGSAGREARIVAAEIRSSCTILTALKDSLNLVEKSPYYSRCTYLTNEMTDASVEMLAEVMDVVNSLSTFTEKMPRGKPKPLQRLQWVFQKPKIIMLRAALDSYRSNLALMLGTLDIAQKATRLGDVSTAAAVKEDEQDCSFLEKLRKSQTESLIRLENLDPEIEAKEQSPPESGSSSPSSYHDRNISPDDDWAVIEESPVPLSKNRISELQQEIGSLRSSRSSFYFADPDTIRSRVSRSSSRLSQLLLDDQIRISKRWSHTLPESRLSWIQDLSSEHPPSSSKGHTQPTQPELDSHEWLHHHIDGKPWTQHQAIKALLDWMSELEELQQRVIFNWLPYLLEHYANNDQRSGNKSEDEERFAAEASTRELPDASTSTDRLLRPFPNHLSTHPPPPMGKPPEMMAHPSHSRAASTGMLPDHHTIIRTPRYPALHFAYPVDSASIPRRIPGPPKAVLNPTWFPNVPVSAPSGSKDIKQAFISKDRDLKPDAIDISPRSPDLLVNVTAMKMAALATVNNRIQSYKQNEHQEVLSADKRLSKENNPDILSKINQEDSTARKPPSRIPSDEEVTLWIEEVIRLECLKNVYLDKPLEDVTIAFSNKDLVRFPEAAIPLMRLVVTRLAISHNHIKSLPTTFAELSRLRFLNIRYNCLKEVPASVFKLTSLEILDLSRNKLVDLSEAIGNLTKLKVLAISGNKIQKLPLSLGTMDTLQLLKYDDNPIIFPTADAFTLPLDIRLSVRDKDAYILVQIKKALSLEIARKED
jgi:hypothetical protein